MGETSTTSTKSVPPYDVTIMELTDFFRRSYRTLYAHALHFGATEQEAEDAIQTTIEEMARRWHAITNKVTFARKAMVSNLLKEKTRSRNLVSRLQERGHVVHEANLDPAMTIWENQQWVDQLLRSLPPTQREVLTYLVDGFKPNEIAILLGKTPTAIRQNLCLALKRLRSREDLAGFQPASSSRKERR